MVVNSAFGATKALNVDEMAALHTRISRASRSLVELKAAFQKWEAGTTFTTRTTLLEPERTAFDVHVEMSRSYPHDVWALHGSDFAHHSRSALDNLNDRLFVKYATESYDPKRIQFPITTTGKEWRNWRQSHRAIPDWITERYKRVQPFKGQYNGLVVLALMNNRDKHVWLQGLGLVPTNLFMDSSFTVQGIDPDLSPEMVCHDYYFGRNQREILMASIHGKDRILEMADSVHHEIVPELFFAVGITPETFEPWRIADLVEISLRVAKVIEYMNGTESALVDYLAMPEHVRLWNV